MLILLTINLHFCKETGGSGDENNQRPGAGCSKFTTSLDNVSLKFKTLMLQIHCHCLLEKYENLLQRFSHFPTKNNSGFDNLVGIYLTS